VHLQATLVKMELCSSDTSQGLLSHAQGALIPLLGNLGSQLLAQTSRECFESVQEIPQQFDNYSKCIKKPSCFTVDKYSWISRDTQLRINAFAVLKNSDLIIHNDFIPWYQCLDSSTKLLAPLRGSIETTFSAPCHIRGHCLNAQRTHLFVVDSGLVKKYKITKKGHILQKSPTLLPDTCDLLDVQVCEISSDTLLVLEPTCLYSLNSKGICTFDLDIPLSISSNANGSVALCYLSKVQIHPSHGNSLSPLKLHNTHVRTLQNLCEPIQVQLSSCGRVIHVLDAEGTIQTFWGNSKTSQRQCLAKSMFLSGKNLFYVARDNSIHILS
jgi:hypothetical protein